MKHATISIKVEPGTGDYGTAERVVFDAPCSLRDAKIVAQFFANHFRTQTTLFEGRTLGHFVNGYWPIEWAESDKKSRENWPTAPEAEQMGVKQ
jgi:hypothetical protein